MRKMQVSVIHINNMTLLFLTWFEYLFTIIGIIIF